MTHAGELVRRITPGQYGEGVILSRAFVELRHAGLSLHEAVPEIVGDGAEAYCAASGYGTPGQDEMGACRVPVAGVEDWFDHTPQTEPFGRWHHDLSPAPREETDERAVALAQRATEFAQEHGLLREGMRKGRRKPFQR